jgi:O-antigen ligase
LNWRLTSKILQSEKAWPAGVSPGSAQHKLDSAYSAAGIYMGDEQRRDSGFRGFNCHNVYMQTLLESGILGLLFLIAIIFLFLKKSIERKRFSAAMFFLAIIIFGIVESVLSAQFAILLFTLLPGLLLSREASKTY